MSWRVGELENEKIIFKMIFKKKWSVPLNTVCEPSQCTADVI